MAGESRPASSVLVSPQVRKEDIFNFFESLQLQQLTFLPASPFTKSGTSTFLVSLQFYELTFLPASRFSSRVTSSRQMLTRKDALIKEIFMLAVFWHFDYEHNGRDGRSPGGHLLGL
jgi:hypothetical protein